MTALAGASHAPRVVALVAAKDRSDSVGATVEALRSIDAVSEVLVIDDGSSDATADAARAAGAWVLRLPANRGKGGAVAAGVEFTPATDVYLLVDADVGATASAAAALLEPVTSGSADMTVGVLPGAGSRGGFGLVARLARTGIARITKMSPQAPLSGQRAVRGELLRNLVPAPRFGLEVGLTVDALAQGARVVEVPVEMQHRHTGRTLSGFAHRARQGADVARALWPRLTTSRSRLVLIVLALLLALAASAWSGSQWEPASVAPTRQAEKVLIFGVPGLAWTDLDTGAMPNLDRLSNEGALAAMSVRTRSRLPSVTEGYATIGAGSRISAGDQLADTVATSPGGPEIVVPEVTAAIRGAGRHLPSLPGSLGDALAAAGLRTAVVGSADIPDGLTGGSGSDDDLLGRPNRLRPTALALMDRRGMVGGGEIDPVRLLVESDRSPFGVRADPDAIVAATVSAMAGAEVTLVDTGDLSRVRALAELAPADFVAAARAQAMGDTDRILGRLVESVPPSTLVLVVSVVPTGDTWRLTPVVASGAGVVPGYLHSPATKRLGLVTLTDLAPTILSSLGADIPSELIGRPMRYHRDRVDVGRLIRLDRDAAYRERIYFRIALGFIVAQAVFYALALVVLRRRTPDGNLPDRVLQCLRWGALAFAAFPLATFLFRGVPNVAALGLAGIGVLVAIDVAIVALASRSRRRELAALAWVMAATVALLLVDIVTGARLQSAAIMGYSPHTAARFYGIGNSAFAVLAATALLVSAVHLELAPRRREALASVGALLLLVLFVDGAPALGDDVGGILTLTPVFVLAMVLFSGRPLSVRGIALAVGITVAAVTVAAGADLLRAPESRTHLGRVASDLLRGESDLPTTIARKAEVNIAVLRASIWTWTVPIIAGFGLLLLVGRRRGVDLLPAGSPRRIGVLMALAAGLLGFALNDSGVIVTALVLVFVGPFIVFVALDSERRRPVLIEPADAVVSR